MEDIDLFERDIDVVVLIGDLAIVPVNHPLPVLVVHAEVVHSNKDLRADLEPPSGCRLHLGVHS